MKTYNHIYTNNKNLELFIKEHNLDISQTLLIQCFDGILDRDATCSLLLFMQSILPHAIIIGASTDGEIIDGATCAKQFVISFSTFESSQIETKKISLEVGSFEAGKALGQEALSFGAKAMVIFADPFHTNGDELMAGVDVYRSDIIVAGGLAGDNGNFQSTYVILGTEIYQESVVAFFVKGESLHVSNISSFNWIPIGPSFKVTSSQDNLVYTIDNIPIIEVYREYFGDDVADKLPNVGVAFPVILNIDGQEVGRAPMVVLENGGLGFGGSIPQGSQIQFGIGNTQLILEASNTTQDKLIDINPEAIFVYSCMARRRFLGTFIDYEIKPLSRIAPVSGFFTYGEFYTNESNKRCSLLNETMTLLALSERENSVKNQPTLTAKAADHDWSMITFNALSHLINKTSIELQDLNRSLQHKVDEEIARNREKDKMMLAQSKQATMGEMMSMIAHQWRQPIATIGLISDNLAIDVALNELQIERIVESTELISKQVHYLSKTIDDFSNYFRPDNIKKTFLISDFYQELSEIIGKSLEHKNIIFGGDLDGDHEICTYKQELFQVCINIINNAKDAILEKKIEGGTIVFMHKHTKGKDQIQIIDNAGGIDAAIAQKIFDPYFSTKDEKHGTGLGLYISKTIVEQNLEGDLSQYNDAGGSVFLIQIPDKATCNV